MTRDELYTETQYGFDWGAAKVTRVFFDKKKGAVTLRVETPRDDIQIYVTKTGKIRVHRRGGGELLPNDKTLATEKVEGEGHATTRQRLKMAHDAIRIASDAFEQVNMWEEGECGSTDMIDCLKDFLPIPNGTTYTRSYQVFLPNPNQPNP